MGDHCDNHEHQTAAIDANTAAISTMNGSFATVKWGVGIGMTIGLFLLGVGITTGSTKMSEIASELRSINTAVHSIALDQVAVKTEMQYLQERIAKLEETK